VRSANFTAVVGDSDADVKERLGRIRDRFVEFVGEQGADAMIAATATEAAVGTPEQVIDGLQNMRRLGCEYAICYFPEAAYDRSGVELFEREVIPALS
jgi:alkanesulfonate monooxygenase SsuD/methylene tetrahydromethanopterin reductase-like flavin-dependent oxidoreductase (luciferase family)